MPDNSNTPKPPFLGTAAPRGPVEFSGVPAACQTMSRWKKEQWESPESFSSFPVLEVSPNVAEFFANAGHFTNQDLKILAKAMAIPFDPNCPHDLYAVLLERIANDPWVFPVVETIVMAGRTLKKGPRGKKRTAKKGLVERLPLQKLRLESHPELHDRLHELTTTPIAPDISAAAFCEYAIMNYYDVTSDEEPFDNTYERATRILRAEGQTEHVENVLGKLADVEDWLEHARLVLEVMEENPEASSEIILAHMHTTIAEISAGLNISGPASRFAISAIHGISKAAILIHEDMEYHRKNDFRLQLDLIGVNCDDDLIDGAISEGLHSALDQSFYDTFQHRQRIVEDLEGKIAEQHAELTTAIEEQDFAKVHELSAFAEENKKRHARMIDAQEVARAIPEAMVALDREGVASALRNYQAEAFAELFDANEFPLIQDRASDILESFNPSAGSLIEEAYPAPEEDPSQIKAVRNKKESQLTDVESTRDQVEEERSAETHKTAASANAEAEGVQDSPTVEPEPEIAEEEEFDADIESEVIAADEISDTAVEPEIQEQSDIDLDTQDEREDNFEPAPISDEILADLIVQDMVGLASDAAEAFEATGRPLPIHSAALRVAAGSRAPHREYGSDVQKFEVMTNKALSHQLSDLGSALVLGAILRPAISTGGSNLRNQVTSLCQGVIGQHLIEVTERVSRLDFSFPPLPDELVEISGSTAVPHRQRLANQISEWCDTFSKKSSRWPFATEFMHFVASSNGPIGAVCQAIEERSPKAVDAARHAMDVLSTASDIERLSEQFATNCGYNDHKLYPRGVEYLIRQFDEPLGLIQNWLSAAQREGSGKQQSAEKLRITVSTLCSQFAKAKKGLHSEADNQKDPLFRSVSLWIADQLDACIEVLSGKDAGSFSTLDEALTAERDLVPPTFQKAIAGTENPAKLYKEVLTRGEILDQEEAFLRACSEGAFETASRVATRFDIDTGDQIQEATQAFVSNWTPQIEQCERRLVSLRKVDFRHQDEINRQQTWCTLTLKQIGALLRGEELHDIVGIDERLRELDEISDTIEMSIREDQKSRIHQYKKPENSEDVEDLLAAIDDLSIETIEDRIAQLRDGRSAAIFETELAGLISSFTPDFVKFAASQDWPTSEGAFENALSAAGPLFVDADRRAAGLSFIALYRDLMFSLRAKKTDARRIRELFEEIGFENVKIANLKTFGRKGSWAGSLSGIIRSDGWFLPPTFGSKSNSTYNVLMVSPETLPETIVKEINTDHPTIILLSCVADVARREELAERLRASAVPALLIDEALIGFAATRRDTRARTIFECGLPYGRVEPYTTDAGQLPPEMFFGREDEIRKILAKTADGSLVYGGRQLGKSALLAHVAATQHNPEAKRYIVRREVKQLGKSERTSEIWRHIASMLPDIVAPGHTGSEDVACDIQSWVTRNRNGRIICMFDEADNFMTKDTRDDYPQLSALKQLMEETSRSFKVVFAGLHNVRRMLIQPNSPLAQLEEPICIGPLNRTEDDKRAAYDLAVSPMRAAGFGFENREAVEEILAWANYYPSLIQEFMKGLLSTLNGTGSGKSYRLPPNGPLWTIPTNILFEHRGFGHIESRIREKFHLTLNLDPRYALVAYTLARLNIEGDEHKALVTGFRPEDLMEEALVFWPKTSEPPTIVGFEALLEELFDLGVLGRVPISGTTNRFNYMLRTRQVAAMLGSGDDIYHALQEIEERDPSVAYERATHRRRYPSNASQRQEDWPYTPLDDLQIERIVSSDTAPVQIICGLEILGLSKVCPSLKRMAEVGHLPGAPNDEIVVEEAKTTKELRQIIDRKHQTKGLMTIAIYEPPGIDDAQKTIDWLERQQVVLNRTVRPLIILSASNAELRGLAIRRGDQTQFLRAWGAEMIRVHLNEVEKTDLDKPEFRQTILEATGGIPAETQQIICAMDIADDPIQAAKEWNVERNLPEEFLNDITAYALQILSLGGDYGEMNKMMLADKGVDLVTIGPDLQAAALITTQKARGAQYRLTAFGHFIAKEIER